MNFKKLYYKLKLKSMFYRTPQQQLVLDNNYFTNIDKLTIQLTRLKNLYPCISVFKVKWFRKHEIFNINKHTCGDALSFAYCIMYNFQKKIYVSSNRKYNYLITQPEPKLQDVYVFNRVLFILSSTNIFDVLVEYYDCSTNKYLIINENGVNNLSHKERAKLLKYNTVISCYQDIKSGKFKII